MNLKDVKEITIPNTNYEQLEYIDIPAGCHFTTNDTGQNSLGYYLDAIWNLDNDSISSDEYPFGSIYYNGSSYFRYHLVMSNSRGVDAASASNTFTDAIAASEWTNRHVIELNFHSIGDHKVYCDGVEMGGFTPTSGTSTGLIYIGGRRFNNNGTVTVNNFPHTIRVFELRSRGTNTTPLTIFYPVKRKSDGKVGLLKVWDKGRAARFCVTETSVEPIAGPVVKNNILYNVSKIEDSNGDIIWGSQAAFPYRRLEYIKFSGAEYINTNTTLSNAYRRMDLKVVFNNISAWSFTGATGSSSSGRFNFGTTNAGKARGELGDKTVNDYSLSTNTGYNFFLVYYSGSKTGRFEVWDLNSETNYWTSNTISNINLLTSTTPNIYVGAKNNNGSAQEYMNANIYGLIIRNSNFDTIVFNGIPCQRKSDGVCGMYDVANNVFRPMQGTTITNTAAGPVIDEYWNLTA